MNETELLRAFRKDRSEEAFAELVRRYAALVYSVANRRLANAALAEDVTQIVFIRFAKTPPAVQTHGELAAWLHRTTLNVAIDTWRSETRRRNREQQAVVMESATQATREDISPNLDQAVNQLNDEDRQAILLRFFGKKTMRDVGTTLGVSEAAAKMRVSRAVDRLRTQLGVGAACTAAALGMLLAEHSVQGVPLQLVSRLEAVRLPKLAGAAATGGLLLALLRISKFKLAAGGAVLAFIGVGVAHFVHSSKVPGPVVASQAADNTTVSPKVRAARQMISAGDSFIAPTSKPPKVLFHVLDAETGFGLSQTKIKFFYFGAGGQSESHDTVTDENGDAPLQGPDDPAKNSAPNVFVAAEGYVPKLVSPTTNDYTMKLDPAMSIGGLVVDEANAPVPGVVIYVEGLGGNKQAQAENVDFQTWPVTNRDDGSWTCSYIPRDTTNDIRLLLKKPGYAVTSRIVPVPYKASFRNYVDLDSLVLVLDSGTTVTGRVTDQHDRPIANTRIKLLDRNRSKRQSTYTDENGEFTLTGVKDGIEGSSFQVLKTNASGQVLKIRRLDPDEMRKHLKGILISPGSLNVQPVNLAVQADGFAPGMKTIQLTNASHIANFTLSSGNYFRGRVVDDLGNPIPDAVAQTDYDFGGDREFDWIAHTDVNGMFQWDSAPAGKTAYWFEADGYEIIRHMWLAADGNDHEITLKRKAGQ